MFQDPTRQTQDAEPQGFDETVSEFAERREFDRRSAGYMDKLKFSRANILLIALFAAGVASVYFLSLRGGPAQATAGSTAAEQEVTNFIQRSQAQPPQQHQADEQTRKIVQEFYHYAARHQVPLDELKSNPFVFSGQARAAPGTPRADPSAEELARQKLIEQARKDLESLRLQSILMGPRGATAIINNTFVRQGERVGGFVVARIEGRTVELTAHGASFLLEMTP